MKTFSAGLETSLQTGAAEQPLGKRVVSAYALTEDETRFLEEAVKKIIRRTAEVAADPDQHLSQVTLSDLPKLSG